MGAYVPTTQEQRTHMLKTLGLQDAKELYHMVPSDVLVKELDLKPGISELELSRHMTKLADKNLTFSSIFRGAGAYWRYIPAMVTSVLSKEQFQTAYTPYQAEISQGVLQSIFEFQTLVCQLSGMDMGNASMYDGASAAAEAALMCGDRRRSRVVVPTTVHPQIIETLETYLPPRKMPIDIVSCPQGVFDKDALQETLKDDTACVLIQQPNYFGNLEDVRTLIEVAHEAGAKVVYSADPISLALLEAPGALGADVFVAEGQPLGLSLAAGGPYLGIMACTSAMVRKLPGRIVGQTHDKDGNPAYVLTLQAREQHIRREKATSNVCSNQALCALGASVYMASMGPKGLIRVAENSLAHAHVLSQRLREISGYDLVFDAPFFNEFVTRVPGDPLKLEKKLADKGILSGLPIKLEDGSDAMLWCATELTDTTHIEALIDALKHIEDGGDDA